MSAPPNPNQINRRTLGLIKQAAQRLKDDAELGAEVRELLKQHQAERLAMVSDIKNQEAIAQVIKRAGAAPA